MKAIITPYLSFTMLGVTFFCSAQNSNSPGVYDNVVVVHSSDLGSPPGDPDDHFDLLTLFSLRDLTIGMVVLDHPKPVPGRQPNFNAVKQAGIIFDRKEVPAVTGLRFKSLSSPDDQGFDYYPEQHTAITELIKRLKSSPDTSVVITTVGGLRDIAAAYNRESALFHRKIKRLIVSIGDSYGLNGTADTNTKRDLNAWRRIMTSGLPIDWMPTNPSKGRGGPSRFCSYWYFIQSELLDESPERIREFLKSEGIDPNETKQRHMWSTPAFVELSGLKSYQMGEEIRWLTPQQAQSFKEAREVSSYEFLPITFSLTDEGVARWSLVDQEEASTMRIFRIKDYYLYNEAMFQFIKQQFNR